jgi:hypothetical protein
MTEHEAPEQSATVEPEAKGAAPVAANRSLSGAANVLALQRRAGNRAVGRALRDRNPLVGRPPPRRPRAPRALQRRRLPTPSDLEKILTDPGPSGPVDAPDAAAHKAGVDRLLSLAATELTNAQKIDLLKHLAARHTFAEWSALPEWKAKIEVVEEIEQALPATILGDPALIDTGPRAGTADAANIRKLVTNARKIFDKIASGSRDADVRDVFGAANVKKAKAKYAAGRLWMNILAARNRILTDRSGYNVEVQLGGLTGFQQQIALSPDTIDNPDDSESIYTLIHESMHAGNDDVGDKGYIDRVAEFPKADAKLKLTNAAHFEVVPRRILDPTSTFAYPGTTFVPAGSTGPAGATPPKTPRERAMNEAYDMFREAWTLGLNLHTLWVQIYRHPRQWDSLDLSTQFGGAMAGRKFSTTMPFWSKVQKLTVHERTHIKSTATDPSTQPVTLIDVAISEGVTRQLARAMGAVPEKEADAVAFENANATPAERAAATTVTKERDLLMTLVLRNVVGSITGNSDRDLRAAIALGTAGSAWKDILKVRPPSAFVD